MKFDLNDKKNIETPVLRVNGNYLELPNIIIQLSNISVLSTTNITPEKFPIFSIFLIIIGLTFMESFTAFSFIALLSGILWIFYWYISVEKVKDLKRLTIITNSGNIFPIVFNDEEFLNKVVVVITHIISHPPNVKIQDIINNTKKCTISVKECTFSDESSVIKNMYE